MRLQLLVLLLATRRKIDPSGSNETSSGVLFSAPLVAACVFAGDVLCPSDNGRASNLLKINQNGVLDVPQSQYELDRTVTFEPQHYSVIAKVLLDAKLVSTIEDVAFMFCVEFQHDPTFCAETFMRDCGMDHVCN